MHYRGPYLPGSSNSCSWYLERKKTTWWQPAMKWLIALTFITLTCNHQWLIENMTSAMKDYQAKVSFTYSAEGQALLAEIPEIRQQIWDKSRAGTLTIEEAARAQWRVIEISSQIHQVSLMSGEETAFIYNCAKECFVSNWQTPEEYSEDHQEMFRRDPERKANYATMIFSQEFMVARDNARNESVPTLGPEHFTALLHWLTKWYLLMMMPSILIVLVSYKFAGLRIKEELLLNPKDFVLRIIFWPFGITISFDTSAKAKRYTELERQYLSETGKNYYQLTSDDKSAIWLKVMQPVLRFEQALIMVKQSEVGIRRPLAVCAMVWIMSVLAQPIRHTELIKSNCISIVQTLPKIGGDDNSEGGKNHSSPILLAVMPATLGWPEVRVSKPCVSKLWTRKEQRFAPYRPRGPPAVRVSDGNIVCLSPDCQQQKGREA